MKEKFDVKRWIPVLLIAFVGAKMFRKGARHARRAARRGWGHRRTVEAL